MLMKKSNAWLILILLIGLGLACDINNQTDKANKLVDEANAIIEKNNEPSGKSTDLYNELMDDYNLTKTKDIEAYKEKNKSKFDELIRLREQSEKLRVESIDKFEQASKLKVSKEYKEYLGIKIQELKKLNDAGNLMTTFIKAFLQTKEVDKINKQLEDYEKKSDDTAREADELSKKVEQFEKDNPNIFEIK
jgi:ribosomal protein L7/L12